LAGALLAPLVVGLFVGRWLSGSSIYYSIVEEGFPLSANYPWDRFAASCLAAGLPGQGRFPLWNPYQAAGNTFIANYLPAFFFLPRWIMYLSDGVFVRDLYVLLRFWLGGFFAYIFMRRIGLKIPGAALATIAFLTGGYFTRYYNENYLNIDLMLGLWLLAGEELARRRSIGAAIGAGLAILAILLGGHPEAAFHALGIMTLWLIYRAWATGSGGWDALRAVALFVGMGAVAGLAASAQLVPFFEALSQSANYHIPNLGLCHYRLKHFATLAYPWIFGLFPEQAAAKGAPLIGAGTSYAATSINWIPYYLGIIPMMFAGVAILKIGKDRHVVYFTIYLIVALGGVFGIPPFHQIFALPLFSLVGNYKHLFPAITFCAAALAGIGLDTMSKLDRRESARAFAVVILFIWFVGAYASHGMPPIAGVRVYVFGLLPMAACAFFLLTMYRFRTVPRLAKQAVPISLIVPVVLTYGMTFYYQEGYCPMNEGGLLNMKNSPFVEYLKNRLGDDRYTSLYPPMLQTFGPYFETADIRSLDALSAKAYWNLLLDVNGGNVQEITSFYMKVGGFQPFADALGDSRLDALRLKYIVSPADLGGMIAAQAILRHASVKTVSPDYLQWDVWDKDGDWRPILYTHPPIKLELDYALPGDTSGLEMAIGWKPGVEGDRRDGAFILVREDRGGEKKIVYARYLPPDEKGWVKTHLPVFPEPGARRTVIVNPLANTDKDWLGWGIKNTAGEFWGYRLAFPGSAAPKESRQTGQSMSDYWKTIQVYEKGGIPPLFSLSDKPRMPVKDEFPARRVAPDEYIFDSAPRLPVLVANGFNYRPGWRLFGKKEIKINYTKPLVFYAELKSNGEKEKGPFKLIYIPWGFRLGLWASVASLISLFVIIFVKKMAIEGSPSA